MKISGLLAFKLLCIWQNTKQKTGKGLGLEILTESKNKLFALGKRDYM